MKKYIKPEVSIALFCCNDSICILGVSDTGNIPGDTSSNENDNGNTI